MFNFIKNIFSSKSQNTIESDSKSAPSVNVEDLTTSFNKCLEQLKAEPTNTDILNNIASICMDLNKNDEAISYYEKSLQIKPTLGKASTNLLKLYNLKRKEAAILKDDKLIQFYLDKIDNLMKMNKETMKKTTTC